MAVRPLDLQAVLAELNHVGRDQAIQRDAAAQNQIQQGAFLANRTAHEDSSVNQPKDVRERDRVLDREQSEGHPRRKKHVRSKAESDQTPEVVSDPDLGNHINLVG